MANNYVQPGHVIDHTAAAAIVRGQLLLIGTIGAVALVDIANGAKGSVQIDGVFEVPKVSADVVTAGAKAYSVTATPGTVSITATAATLIGVFTEAAGAGVLTARVKLNAGN